MIGRASLLTLVGVALGFALISCESPQSGVGTNTSWMVRCDGDEECGADACLCGRCTQSCFADTDCPSAHICAREAASLLQCQGDATRTCQPGCSEDVPCAAGRLCQQGACVDPLSRLDCPDGALVCEDFETGTLGGASVITEGNELRLVSAFAPSGDSALRATIGVAPSVSYLRADFPARQSGRLYLSGWVEVPSTLEHDMAPLGFWADTDEDWALRVVVRNGRLELWSSTNALDGPYALAPGWHCVQMDLVIADGIEGSVLVRVDGVSALEAASADTLPTGGIQSLAMGCLWAGYPGEIAVDRVVLGTEPVSCGMAPLHSGAEVH